MPKIHAQSGLCTVIVTADAAAEVVEELEQHARLGLELFVDFPGFVAGALHRSDDGTRLVQYLQWRSETEYLACVNDPSWDGMPSTRRFMAHVHAGRAQVDVRVFEVLAATDAAPLASG